MDLSVKAALSQRTPGLGAAALAVQHHAHGHMPGPRPVRGSRAPSGPRAHRAPRPSTWPRSRTAAGPRPLPGLALIRGLAPIPCSRHGRSGVASVRRRPLSGMRPVRQCLIDQFGPDSARSSCQARGVPHTDVASCDDSRMPIEGDAEKHQAYMDWVGWNATRASAELRP